MRLVSSDSFILSIKDFPAKQAQKNSEDAQHLLKSTENNSSRSSDISDSTAITNTESDCDSE